MFDSSQGLIMLAAMIHIRPFLWTVCGNLWESMECGRIKSYQMTLGTLSLKSQYINLDTEREREREREREKKRNRERKRERAKVNGELERPAEHKRSVCFKITFLSSSCALQGT